MLVVSRVTAATDTRLLGASRRLTFKANLFCFELGNNVHGDLVELVLESLDAFADSADRVNASNVSEVVSELRDQEVDPFLSFIIIEPASVHIC